MSVKEEVIQLVEELSESDLLVVKKILRGLRLPDEPKRARPPRTPEERRAAARAGYGSLAHLPGSVEDFLREKREDVEREEEQRRARVRDVYGKYAHTHTSVDAFLARKREDVELEEERYRRRHPEEA